MRAKGRRQGRFIALSGLKKVPGPPGSRFPMIIINATGLPIFFLCEWYRRKKEFDPGRTPETYLDMLLPWAGFLHLQGYAWNDPPDRVRAYLVEFLRTYVGCLVAPAQEDGYLVETTGASPLAKSSLGVLLAALTSLYDVLSDARYYPYQNPLRSERLATMKQEHLRQIKNASAPDHAGIRSETHQETHQAYPTIFFCQKRSKVWAPEIVMEPDAVQEQMRKVIHFMIQHATFQRDQVILLLLRQTGARLSEVVEMTVGGYRKAQHTGRALVKNKGSRGREEKVIYFTNVIEERLLRYIRTERAKHDPQGRKRLDQLSDAAPLFLTEGGDPYTRSAFYYHWNKLFETAQQQLMKQDRVEFSPHDLRHLCVTRAMTSIKRSAQGNPVREAELFDGFRQLMGWHSSRTMETYTHVLHKRQALLEVVLVEDDDKQVDQILQPVPSAESVKGQPLSQRMGTEARAFPPQEDEFSWYEQ
jgi:site-specific recombinase XerD